jgi:hypothetical protein
MILQTDKTINVFSCEAAMNRYNTKTGDYKEIIK